MTDTMEKLLAAIRENPGDKVLRGAYADCLKEHDRMLDGLIQNIIAEPDRDEWRLDYAAELERTAGKAECEACKGCGKIGIGNNGNPYMATCDECHGTGRVSDGRAELAEFVRVQVELAKPILCNKCDATGKHKRGYCNAFMYGCDEFGDDDCSHKNEIISCTECTPKVALLRRRERELWPAVRGMFPEECLRVIDQTANLAGNINDGRGERAYPTLLIQRGLPAVVRCTLAEWMGGECQNCGGFGEFRRRYDNGDGPEGPCPDCGGKWNSGPFDDRDDYWDRGTGRTPGIGPRLAQRWPIERVEATDAVIHPSGGNATYYVGGLGVYPRKYWRQLEGHRTPSAARAALSAACIAWARSQPIEEGRS